MQIISRKEAKEKGLVRYFTGKPCKYNQIAERYVARSRCCCFICEAKDRALYSPAYRDRELANKKQRERLKAKRIQKHNPVFEKPI